VGTPHSSSPSSISSSQQRSLAASICVSLPKRPFGAPASETTSAGHAYQLRHLTNGEANQKVKLIIKGGDFSEPVHSSFDAHRSSSWHIKKNSQPSRLIKEEETTSGRPATMPRGPGTASPSSARWLPAHHIQDIKQMTEYCMTWRLNKYYICGTVVITTYNNPTVSHTLYLKDSLFPSILQFLDRNEM
jgi:hypothetical protein